MHLRTSKRSRRDLRRARRRQQDLEKLWTIVERLLSDQPLSPSLPAPSAIGPMVPFMGMPYRT